MSWDDAKLKTAYAALSPAPANNAAAVIALNAQTDTVTVDVPVQLVADYLAEAAKLPTLLDFAASPPSGAAAGAVTAAAELAFAFEHSGLLPTFQMTNSVVAGEMQTWLADLVAAGVLASADQTAILALATATVPAWQPPVTTGDLATALGQ